MSHNSSKGKAYTLDDIERLANIESFGQFSGAIKGLAQRTRLLESERQAGLLQVESLKSQLLSLRAEVNSLKE